MMVVRAWYLGEVLYPPLAAFARTSIAVFLLHIAVEKWHVWVIRFNLIVIWIFSIVYFFRTSPPPCPVLKLILHLVGPGGPRPLRRVRPKRHLGLTLCCVLSDDDAMLSAVILLERAYRPCRSRLVFAQGRCSHLDCCLQRGERRIGLDAGSAARCYAVACTHQLADQGWGCHSAWHGDPVSLGPPNTARVPHADEQTAAPELLRSYASST